MEQKRIVFIVRLKDNAALNHLIGSNVLGNKE